jgi:hypothetical protein
MAGNALNSYYSYWGSLRNEITALSHDLATCPPVDFDEILKLKAALGKLDAGLEILQKAKPDRISIQDKQSVEDKWRILRDMAGSAVKELQARQTCSQVHAPPSLVWLELSFIKALRRADKLCALVDSVLKYPRDYFKRLVTFLDDMMCLIDERELLTVR